MTAHRAVIQYMWITALWAVICLRLADGPSRRLGFLLFGAASIQIALKNVLFEKEGGVHLNKVHGWGGVGEVGCGEVRWGGVRWGWVRCGGVRCGGAWSIRHCTHV
jgi:hypothetical protein